MKKLFEEVDIFNKSVNFRYKSHREYKNLLGGVFTLIYMLISLTIFSFLFEIYIKRKEKRVTYQATKFEERFSLNLTEQKFSLNINAYISDKNSNKKPLTPQEFFTLFYVDSYIGPNNVEFKQCSSLNYLNHFLNNMTYCIAPYFKNGDMVNKDNEYRLHFIIKNKTRIHELFNERALWVYVFMKDTSINLEDYDNPIISSSRFSHRILDENTMINHFFTTFLTYGITQVKTDYSWFIEFNERTAENMNLVAISEEQIFNFGKIFYGITLIAGYDGHLYKRSFQKFPEFLASASTLTSTIYYFFLLLIIVSKNFSLDIELINNIFYHDPNSINQKVISKIENSSLDKIVINKNYLSSIPKKFQCNDKNRIIAMNNPKLGARRKLVNDNLKNQKQIINKQSSKFNQCGIALLLCNICQRKKHQLYFDYLAGKSILNYFFNSENYLLKMIELELLKSLLLDKDHLDLFKFIKLDYLANSSDNDFMSILQNLGDYSLICNSQKRDNIILQERQSFNNLVKKSTPSKIDKIILKNLDASTLNHIS